jgi:hypothetical protein
MPQINILNILQGDNQSTVVDKVNYNFDQILSAGGGPQGQQGLIGPTGPIGPQGVQGVQGLQGPSGTKWFVQDTTPASGSVSGSNPFLYPTLGDYWLDPDSPDQDISVFTATGWVYTGYGLAAGDLFQKVTPINIIGGATGQAILIAGTAGNQTLTLTDASINPDLTPGGIAIDNLNYENSKLKISTKDGRQTIVSFSRSDYDIGNTTMPKGTTAGVGDLNNPRIEWDALTSGVNNYFDFSLTNPTGAISIKSLGTSASGGVNLLANGEISAQTNSSYILLKTAGTSGTYVSSNFLEFGNQVSTPVNNPISPFFVNTNGVGIGVGTGGFLQTGNDLRKLAVSGNVSVGKTPASHTSSLFVGSAAAPNNNNKGTLFSEGFIGVGATSPTGVFGGTVIATGPAEAQGRFPSLWVTSPNYGPGLQIKTLGSSTFSGRTLIGDGVFDFQNSGGLNGLAGTGPDLTQEVFTSGNSFGSGVLPLISYQHKITDPSNTTGTSPVFGITTFTNSGAYSSTGSANKTLIQTRNSNQNLIIQANGGTAQFGTQNSASIGASKSNYLTVYGGPSGSSTGGTVTIGSLSDTVLGVSGSLTGGNSSSTQSLMRGHALTVTGITTVGTNYPWSLFNSGSTNTDSSVGNLSMLKIHRNLYSSSLFPIGQTIASGLTIDNYPNGLEITSYRSQNPKGASGPGRNQSVAIAVGATSLITDSGNPGTAAPTGFFVSDTGQSVGIGDTPNSFYGLNVSGAGVPVVGSGNFNKGAANFRGKVFINQIGDPDTGLVFYDSNVNNFQSLSSAGSFEIQRWQEPYSGTTAGTEVGPGLNFWTPFTSSGNYKLWITDNGQVAVGYDNTTKPLSSIWSGPTGPFAFKTSSALGGFDFIAATAASFKFAVNGNIRANGIYITSDLREKENIEEIKSGLETILKLRPVDFDWKSNGVKSSGFIAQEVAEIIPQAVTISGDPNYEDGKYLLDPKVIIPYLTSAVQEQNFVIKAQKEKINSLEERLERLEKILNEKN